MHALALPLSTLVWVLVGAAPVNAQQAQPTDPTAASQATYNQIVQTSQQVASIAADPGISVDIKSQQITMLAGQFNQSVAIWQQQIVAIPATAPAAPAPAQAMATAPQVTNPGATGIAASPVTVPPPPNANANPNASLNADQLRTQIGVLSQQMATIAQDPSIPADSKATQLSGLSAQFNQLVVQLQQLGG